MQTRLLEHLYEYNILSSEQYGFQPNLNTDNATYHLLILYVFSIISMTSSISFRLFMTLYGFTECKMNE